MAKQLAKADEEFLRETAARIRQHMSRTAWAIVETGRNLIAVKDRVGHGNFLIWIRREFDFPERTVQRMMSAAEKYEGKSDTVSHLSVTALYELSAPETPEEVREEIEQRIAAGDEFTRAEDVRALKEKAKQRAKVVEHGIAVLVEAVDAGKVPVPVSDAVAFAKTYAQIAQDELIIKAGRDVAAAVREANAARSNAAGRSVATEETPDMFEDDKTKPKQPKPNPVSPEAKLAEEQQRSAAERREVTEGLIKMLDLFERGNVDPAARAAFVVEHFDQGILDKAGPGKFSTARIGRAMAAMVIVFKEITGDFGGAGGVPT
jgi:Protein of unknown function (DUF3102)